MSRIVRIQVAIVENDQLLLIQHREHVSGYAYWLLPGGGAEGDEDEVATARREAFEETQLDVAVERLLLDEAMPAGDYYQRARTYLCRPVSGIAQPGHEPEEDASALYGIAALLWLDLRDEANWPDDVRTNQRTYPLLKHIRSLLGYEADLSFE